MPRYNYTTPLLHQYNACKTTPEPYLYLLLTPTVQRLLYILIIYEKSYLSQMRFTKAWTLKRVAGKFEEWESFKLESSK